MPCAPRGMGTSLGMQEPESKHCLALRSATSRLREQEGASGPQSLPGPLDLEPGAVVGKGGTCPQASSRRGWWNPGRKVSSCLLHECPCKVQRQWPEVYPGQRCGHGTARLGEEGTPWGAGGISGADKDSNHRVCPAWANFLKCP